MEIKLEKLTVPDDTVSLESIINSRFRETSSFRIDLGNVHNINLASFNALVRLYMKYNRAGKEVVYVNCHSDKIKHLIAKTQFYHVFNS
ncbi:MAG: STAS domain-containing protein [Cyclobacteriaceae bacterium]